MWSRARNMQKFQLQKLDRVSFSTCIFISKFKTPLKEKYPPNFKMTPNSTLSLLTDPNMGSNDPSQKDLQADVGISGSNEERESGFEEGEDDAELEKLELEVEQMAGKILEFRATLPGQLNTTLVSLLSAQRPLFPNLDPTSDPGPSTDSNAAVLTEEDQKLAEKARLLKDKISSNISTLPVVLSRMTECMSKIDKLDSCNGIIHPAFKKKKTS